MKPEAISEGMSRIDVHKGTFRRGPAFISGTQETVGVYLQVFGKFLFWQTGQRSSLSD